LATANHIGTAQSSSAYRHPCRNALHCKMTERLRLIKHDIFGQAEQIPPACCQKVMRDDVAWADHLLRHIVVSVPPNGCRYKSRPRLGACTANAYGHACAQMLVTWQVGLNTVTCRKLAYPRRLY